MAFPSEAINRSLGRISGVSVMNERWRCPVNSPGLEKATRRARRGWLAFFVCLLLMCTTWSTSGQAPTPPSPVVNSPSVPLDVMIPGGFQGNPIAFFDDYSWRAFIAMVWPALKDHRGDPDTMQAVDGPGPRVFETYKSLAEVFHSDGSSPTSWNDFDPPQFNPCEIQTGFGDVTLGSFSKFSNLGQAGFGNLLGPLVAQNTTYDRYLTGFNKTEFQNILNQKWYLRGKLPKPP